MIQTEHFKPAIIVVVTAGFLCLLIATVRVGGFYELLDILLEALAGI